MTDAAKVAIAWADNALVVMPHVADMAEWIVTHRAHLFRLEQLAPTKRQELQVAITKRWAEIDARRATIRDGIG